MANAKNCTLGILERSDSGAMTRTLLPLDCAGQTISIRIPVGEDLNEGSIKFTLGRFENGYISLNHIDSMRMSIRTENGELETSPDETRMVRPGDWVELHGFGHHYALGLIEGT